MMGGEVSMLFGGGFMWIIGVIVIVLLFLVIKFAMGNGFTVSESNKGECPLDILKKRYARSEIDDEEYDQKRKTLES